MVWHDDLCCAGVVPDSFPWRILAKPQETHTLKDAAFASSVPMSCRIERGEGG